MFVNRTIGLVFIFLFCSCKEEPHFIRQIPHPVVISKSYTVQEFVRSQSEIIWVIDNSGSMQDKQDALKKNMNIFINTFESNAKGARWKMGLLSTDKNDPPYIGFAPWGFLDHGHPDPVSSFNQAISRLGTNGDTSYEQSFFPIRLNLSLYKDFLREKSKLFIIMVSDEDEQGELGSDEFIRYLYLLKDVDSIFTYGVFEMAENGCGTMDFSTSRYGEFIRKTKGQAYPICSENYGKILASIGLDIAKKTSISKIELDEAPVLDTIKVYYRGDILRAGRSENDGYWSYNFLDNSIYFHNLDFLVGFDLEKVRVDYQKFQPPEE